MDYYQILGVSRDASASDIKSAYRRLSKKYHPDKSKGDKGTEEKYKQINRAYEALSDPKKKQAYDQFGNEDGPQFGGGGGNPFGQGFEGGFGDIFETFFGGGAGKQRGRADTSGRDMEARLTISLEEAFNGLTKKIRIQKAVACDTCKGSGSKEGAKLKSCSTCNGTGQVTRTAQSFFGVIQQAALCDECRGSGKVPETPCKTCKGEGRVESHEEVEVQIPAGIADRQTLRVRGKGEAGRQGGEAGDLFVRIRVAGDPRFTRDGNDLLTEVTISAPDAVLGTEVSVATFAGSVKLKVPAGTQPKQILRVKGKGMPVLSSSRHGDLYVTVNIEIPKKVGKEEKKIWEDLR